jgi:hypothetical protein
MPIPNYQIPGVYVTQTTNNALTATNPTALNVAIIADNPVPGTNTDTFNGVAAISGATLGQLSTPMVNNTFTGAYTTYSGYTVVWTNPSGTTVTGTYGSSYLINNPTVTSGTASGTWSPFSYLTTSGLTNTTNFVTVTGTGSQWVFTTSGTNVISGGAAITITGFTGAVSGFNGSFVVASGNASTFYVSNASNSGVGSTTITGTASYSLPSGTVQVTYGHNWGGFGTFYEFTQVSQVYGSTVSGTTITNPAALAAQMAFLNGANTVTILPVARVNTAGSGVATIFDWTNTFQVGSSYTGSNPVYLSALNNVDAIVPLYGNVYTSGSTYGQVIPYGSNSVASQIATYLTTQASLGIYQRAFIGVDGTSNQVTTSSLQALASGFGNTAAGVRTTLVFPTSLNFNPGLSTTTGLTNVNFNIPGYYLAAAAAGVYVGQTNVATPITNKTVAGFNYIPNQISLSDAATNYLPYGITTVYQRRDGNFWILQGLTTNVNNWLTQEISLNAIGDVLANQVRNALQNTSLIGGPLNATTTAAALGAVQGQLVYAVQNKLIQSYQNLSFSINPATPTTINITFQYSPTYPINYIQATLSLNTQTGTVIATNSQSNTAVY